MITRFKSEEIDDDMSGFESDEPAMGGITVTHLNP